MIPFSPNPAAANPAIPASVHAGPPRRGRGGAVSELRSRRSMTRVLTSIATFLTVQAGITTISSLIWDGLVTDRLYNCTDAVGFDYLQPGNWVHGHVAFVSQVVAGRSMSEPDTIKEGWSVAGLWGLWLAFFVPSLVGSFFVARRTWAAAPAVKAGTAPDGGLPAQPAHSGGMDGPPLRPPAPIEPDGQLAHVRRALQARRTDRGRPPLGSSLGCKRMGLQPGLRCHGRISIGVPSVTTR